MAKEKAKTTWFVMGIILLAIILIAGIYTTNAGTRELNSKIDDIGQNLNSLSESVEQLVKKSEYLSDQINNLSNKTKELAQNITEIKKKTQELSEYQDVFRQDIGEIRKELQASAFPLEITDAMNRLVVIPYKPERIVSIAPSITEILFSIGAGSLVVGVDEYSNYPQIVNELKNNGTLQVVGGFGEINIEKVARLNPDIVIGTTGVQYRPLSILSQLGFTTLSLPTEKISDVFATILLLGKITGHYTESLKLVESIKQRMYQIYNKTLALNDEQRPSVVFIVWVDPIYAAGKNSWIEDLIYMAGGKNALSDIESSWPTIGWESIVEKDPDFIIFTEYAGGLSNVTQAIEWLASQPGGKNLTAVINNHVYMVHGELNDILQRPSIRIDRALLALTFILHPEVFGFSNVPNDISVDELPELTIDENK